MVLGCASAIVLKRTCEIKPVTPLQAIPVGIAKALQDHTEATVTFQRFHQNCNLHRGQLVAQFEQLREAVNTSERMALAQFDAVTKQRAKALCVQLEAFDVMVRQFAGKAVAGVADATLEHSKNAQPTEFLAPLALSELAMRLLKDVINTTVGWSVAQNNINDAVLDQAQCRVMNDMCAVVANAKEEFCRSMVEKHARVVRNTPFEGQHIVKFYFPHGGHGSGFAVSPDGSIIAMLTRKKDRCIQLFRSSNGSMIRSFGLTGSGLGEFKEVYTLCFTADGRNVLLADYGNKRIAEVTLMGDHVRYIARENHSLEPFFVDANTEVIITSGYNDTRVHVFQYSSGACLRTFMVDADGEMFQFKGLKLSHCGTKIITVEEYGRHRLFMFTLTGERLDEHAMQNIPSAMCVLSSGEIAVCNRDRSLNWSIAIYSIDKLRFKTAIGVLASVNICSNGDFLFALSSESAKHAKIDVWWA